MLEQEVPTWKTALTYLVGFALAMSAAWYSVEHGRLLGETPLHGMQFTHKFASPLHSRRPIPPACPTENPYASKPISGLLAPPLVWSRSYYDMVRMDNGHVPMSYFMRDTKWLAAPGSLAMYFGELQGWVWVRTGTYRGIPNDTEQFARTVLPNISRPIRLITSDGDSVIPGDLAPGVADAITRKITTAA